MQLLAIILVLAQAARASIIFCGERNAFLNIPHLIQMIASCNLLLPNTLMCWPQQYQEDIPMLAMEHLRAPMDLPRLHELPELDAQVHIDQDPATQMFWQPQCQNQSHPEALSS